MNTVGLVLDCNWRYRYKLMVFNIYKWKYPYLPLCIGRNTQIAYIHTQVYI